MMFEAIDVWRRSGKKCLVRYRCFRLIPDGGYCVQSADAYGASDSPTRAAEYDAQFIELLRGHRPDERAGVFTTLEEAIRAFDEDFGNEY